MMYKTKTFYAFFFSGVAFGATCTGPGIGDCSDSNTVCDATSHKCACSTTSYKPNATTCATSKGCCLAVFLTYVPGPHTFSII